jgi:hypothetical protein
MNLPLLSVAVALALTVARPPLVAQDAAREVRERSVSGQPPHARRDGRHRHSAAARRRVSGQFWSVFIPSGLPHPARTQLEQIELARRMIDAYGKKDP